jgi:multiple sugar transport system substrate-binding protein
MITRRTLLQGSTALAALAAAGDLMGWARAWAATEMLNKPEDGAKLQLLRWKRFVQSEEDAFVKLVEAFTQATGVPVEVSSETLDD